jgi:hypothetical protein
MLHIQMRPEPDRFKRDEVSVTVPRVPVGVTVQPGEVVRNLRAKDEMLAAFQMKGLVHDATPAWYRLGVEMTHGERVIAASELVQLGRIQQVDRERAVPMVDLFWGRQAFRANPDQGCERLVYRFYPNRIDREKKELVFRFDYLVEAAKNRKMVVEYRGEGGTKTHGLVLAGETGWNSLTFALDDVDLRQSEVEIALQSEDGGAFTAGRLRFAE